MPTESGSVGVEGARLVEEALLSGCPIEAVLFSESGQRNLELRFESFNTFNHTQFNVVDTNKADGNFGQVTSVWDPRLIQIAAKLHF